ncbi:MAG: ComEC/Rec2 family competence protein [Mucilaginibacter sp.]|uniref:ComEC/Rec2 family competence protein n=1 Tax=Mucilaginibacter sp. TaxID=1882438 RepID=UPI0034E501F2
MKNTFFIAESPFVLLLMHLLSGIFLSVVFSFGNILPLLLTCIFTISFIFCILNWKYADWKIYRKAWIGGILIYLFLFLLGIFLAEKNKEINNSNHFSKQKATSLLVTIIQEPKQTGNVVRFNTLVTHTSFNGKISVSSGSMLVALKLDSSQKNNFNYGDEFLVPNQYKPIDAPFNPAEFNYKLWLQHQNIYFQTFLNPNQYQLITTNRGNPIIAYALAIRKKLVQKYQKYLHDPDALSVASTLILGYRADLSTDVLQAYSKTGTIHVLSVSGMHVALVYLIINLLLRFLNRKRSGVLLKAFISILLIWVYALVTGFSPAVCRAAVMITFVIVGRTYNRHISMLNILLVSAFVLLLYNPNFVTDVGFQLSYLAVVGLIILQPIIENLLEFKHQFARRVWSLLSVSLAAQLITFPVSVFYFHQFPVYFLLSNLFIVLPSALIMYVGIAFLFVPDIPVIAKPLAFVLEKSIVGMNQGLSWIEHLPFGSWNKLWITVPEYLILYTIIVCLFVWLVHRKSLLLQVGAVFTTLFLVSFSYKKIQAQQQDEIVFLNLRKNCGIVFKNGNEAVVFTDLKTSDKSFQYSVQPYLDSCKSTKVSFVNSDKNFTNAVFSKQNKLVQFKNQLIFVADKGFEQQSFSQKIKVDAVFITQNPKIDLAQISKNLIFDRLIVASDNGDYLIQKLTGEAAADGRKIIVLKRNKAFLLQSNL